MSRPSSRCRAFYPPRSPRPPCHRLCPFRSLLWCQSLSRSLVTASFCFSLSQLSLSRGSRCRPSRVPAPSGPLPTVCLQRPCRRPSPGPRTPTASRSGGGGGGRLRRGGPGASPFFPTSQTPGAERSLGLGAGRLAGSPRPRPGPAGSRAGWAAP